jgi:DNA invertase Pin-like site-specific DNA recombinase
MEVVMKALGYIRVSKVAGREGESFISPAEQRRAIEACAARKGLALVGFLEELDESGGSDNRPKWQEAIRRVEAGEVGAVVVWNLSRFSRNLVHARLAIQRLEDVGGRLYSATEEADGFTRDILFLFAEYERKRAKDGWSAAVRNAVERGVHIAGTLPLGYLRGGDKRLVVDEATAPLVRGAFERRAEGLGWAEIARWMATQGYPISRTGIRLMVKNRLYLGEARNGEHVNVAAHEPLVSIDLYERAQRATKRTVRVVNGAVSGKVVSQGLAHCSNCGHSLWPNTRHRKTGRVVIGMLCQNPHCETHATIQAHHLDAEVEAQVLGRLSVAFRTSWPTLKRSEVSEARQRLADAERVRDAFLDNAEALPLIGKEKWNAQLAKLTVRVDAARAAVAEAAETDELDAWFEQPVRFKTEWLSADVLGRRRLLQNVVERVDVLPVHGQRGIPASERVRVVWKEPRRRSVKIGLARSA